MTTALNFELTNQNPDGNIPILVPLYTDSKPNGGVPQQVLEGFSGEINEISQVYLPDNPHPVFLLGLGALNTEVKSYQSFIQFRKKNQKKLSDQLLVDLRHLDGTTVYQCVLGLSLADYTVGSHKTDTNAHDALQSVRLLVSESTEILENYLVEATHTAQVMKRIYALVDAPANTKTPQYLAQWAQKSGDQHGYQVEILNQDALVRENLHALLAVGRGSEHPPVLIKMIYQGLGEDSSNISLGLVGKGVTFDTGGISLKKPANMHYMKSDMAGAAAVMGTVELIARLQLPINVAAVIPMAENSIDAHSVRPGDVIDSFSGKSIEIIDTDAEGRLILADALSYIQKHSKPEVLIDLATLTGSVVATLGYEAAGLFTQKEDLARALTESGEAVGEKLWRLPLWDGYGTLMESDIADIKNLSSKPVAGAITAAKFLEFFVKKEQAWAHLDIAGTAFGDTPFAKMKSATGYGVRLLVDFTKHLITNKTQ